MARAKNVKRSQVNPDGTTTLYDTNGRFAGKQAAPSSPSVGATAPAAGQVPFPVRAEYLDPRIVSVTEAHIRYQDTGSSLGPIPGVNQLPPQKVQKPVIHPVRPVQVTPAPTPSRWSTFRDEVRLYRTEPAMRAGIRKDWRHKVVVYVKHAPYRTAVKVGAVLVLMQQPLPWLQKVAISVGIVAGISDLNKKTKRSGEPPDAADPSLPN